MFNALKHPDQDRTYESRDYRVGYHVPGHKHTLTRRQVKDLQARTERLKRRVR